MKKLLTFLMLCGSLHIIQAQGNVYEANILQVLEHLDFTEVTTNLLLERALPFVEVDSFDGVQLSAYNKMDVNKFGRLYATLYAAVLDTSALLQHPDAYMDVRDSLNPGDTIPLAIFHYDYHCFRQDALSENLLTLVDSQLYNLPSLPTNSQTSSNFNILLLAFQR